MTRTNRVHFGWRTLGSTLPPVLAMLAVGCAFLQPVAVPIRSIERKVGEGEEGRVLLVLLHGRHDRAAKFFEEGFDEVAAQSGGRFDLVSVEAPLGYYVQGEIENRIGADLLVPARSRGYTAVWLVGISRGGLGALATAQRHPDDVDGVIALAPYLGSRPILDHVENGAPLPEKLGKEDRRTKELWDWLRQRPPGRKPIILVGVGENDSFLSANRFLSRFQPAGRIETVPGGHDWDTWKRLFRWALTHPEGPAK